jgi:hypothetical protein
VVRRKKFLFIHTHTQLGIELKEKVILRNGVGERDTK